MLFSWNILEIGICSTWHSSGAVQAGVLGHSQDQRDAPSPSAGLPRSGGRHPWECRGWEERGFRYSLSVFDGWEAVPVFIPALLHSPKFPKGSGPQ